MNPIKELLYRIRGEYSTENTPKKVKATFIELQQPKGVYGCY